jgi:hypothetical protein
MPMLYLHLMFGGAFLAVWLFIANMLFRDRLIEIRRDRVSQSRQAVSAPNYLRHRKNARSARVA